MGFLRAELLGDNPTLVQIYNLSSFVNRLTFNIYALFSLIKLFIKVLIHNKTK